MSKAKKLPPGIDLRPSGKYRVRVSANGNRLESKSFTRLEDAVEYQRSLTIASQTGRMDQVNADLITLRELAAEHFAAEGDALSTRTLDSYDRQWNNVRRDHIGNMPIRMLAAQPKLIEEFRDRLLAAGVGPQSVKRTLQIMQRVLERGVNYHGIPNNPAKSVRKPSGKRKAAIRALAPKEVEAIRSQLKNGDSVLVSVLAYSGIRPEEARALTWRDVQERTLIIDKAAEPDGSVKGTKTERNRSVRLMAPLRDDLAKYRAASGNPKADALIFPRADGKAWTDTDYRNWRRRTWRKAVEKSKVDIKRPYDLRHSAASLWLHEGASLVQVAAWIGNSVVVLSGDYAHVIEDLDPDDRRPAVDIINEARQDNPRTTLRVLTSPEESSKPRPRRRKSAAAR